jgi:hypothetical protein
MVTVTKRRTEEMVMKRVGGYDEEESGDENE